MKGTRKTEVEEPAFDQSMGQLEQIVARLEAGDLPLEEALQAFEQGVGLVRHLTQRLNEADARIEVLTRAARGNLELQPFDPDNESE